MSEFSETTYPEADFSNEILVSELIKKFTEKNKVVYKKDAAGLEFMQELMDLASKKEKEFYDSLPKDVTGKVAYTSLGMEHGTLANLALKDDVVQESLSLDFKELIAKELWVGMECRSLKGERLAFSGNMDNIAIVGNTIYILDYKPNLHFATIEQMTAEGSGNPLPRKHFITSIPQVGGYGIITDALFKLKAAGFDIQCITYNSEAYCAYDPFSALEQSVDFYCKYAKKFPDWAWLLDEGLLRKMADKHKIDF